MKTVTASLAIRIALFTALTIMPGTTMAQDKANPRDVLERLFETEVQEEWFAPDFLAQIPAGHVSDIIRQLEGQYGSLRAVEGQGQRFMIRLEEAEVPTQLVLDGDGRIAGLRFEPPITTGTLSDHIKAIASLSGTTSVLVLSEGQEKVAHNSDEPLAVGSAAKLVVLKAVTDAVREGRLQWDQVVPLDPAWKSLPTGILQDWPAGTPLTIASLANLMISISDNTATDALIRVVGREQVDEITPRNAPFPTTRELFALKSTENAELRRTWADGSVSVRRDILDRIASAPLPDAAGISADPTIEVEWFLSARELCTLMDELAGQPALQINPGLAEPVNWDSVAYKGGTEPGVLNFTTRVVDESGNSHCIVATWNNADGALDEKQLAGSYQGILRQIRAD